MAPETPSLQSAFHDRIGPIFDSAYLKNVNPAIIREITLISARAQLSAAHAHVQALEAVVKVIENAKMEPVVRV